jgi:hypothetical protein
MNSGINIATMIVMALTIAVIVFTIDHLIRVKIHLKVQKKGVFDFYRSKNNKLKIKYRG